MNPFRYKDSSTNRPQAFVADLGAGRQALIEVYDDGQCFVTQRANPDAAWTGGLWTISWNQFYAWLGAGR